MATLASLADARSVRRGQIASYPSGVILPAAQPPTKRRRLEQVSATRCSASAAHSQGGSDNHAVSRVLREAERAAKDVQRALQHIHELPSARPPGQELPPVLQSAMSIVIYAAAATLLLASHAHSRQAQWLFAAVAGVSMGLYSRKKGYVSTSGAIAAACVGFANQASSIRAPVTLFAFFLSSSKLTKLKEELKSDTEDFKAGGQRDWKQVVCTGLIPTVLAVLSGHQAGFVDLPLGAAAHRAYTALMGGFLGYFACCCGDTWASELGQLSQQQPRLITTFRPVRKGTNGGVTWLGLGASVAGGLFMGLVFWASALASPSLRAQPPLHSAAVRQWSLVLVGALSGLFGSLLDSLLGATVQYTGFNMKTQKITGKPGPDAGE
ncbi:hypothetical protein WJX73_005091 [Symbiochloris irregularis]|uniref:Transmembrane protein 19 n=1 Tax=Symbiochloris irregularis TaxID=706552 RepID=A0AAW1NUH1_9CHLO